MKCLRSTLSILALVSAILIVPAGAVAWQNAERAAGGNHKLTTAIEYLQNSQNDEAFALIEQVLADEPKNPKGHFYRGLALGRLGRDLDSQHSFLVTAGLVPGEALVHRYASIASYQVEDYGRSWEQAIIAARAGIDMRDVVALLRNTTTAPDNWLQRIEAPLVYVDPADVTGVLQARTYGFGQTRVGGNDAPQSDMDAAQRGINAQVTNNDMPFAVTASDGGNTGAADWGETGARKVQNNYKQISEMMRRFREAVAHGTQIGLASHPDAAAYHLKIEIIDLAGEMSGRLVGCELLPDQEGNMEDADVDTDVYEAVHPKHLDGYISLINRSGQKVYDERLNMTDITSLADLHARINRYIEDIELVVGQ